MMAGIAQVLFEVALQVFLEFICYALGRLVVSIFSLGRWTCDRLNSNRPRGKGSFRLPAKSGKGRRHLSVEATQLVGFLTFVILVGALILTSI
jgi:hypothetical protein